MQIQIGKPVQINAPRSGYHQLTGTIVDAHLDGDGIAVTARVQIDGRDDDLVWLHRCSLQPVQEAA